LSRKVGTSGASPIAVEHRANPNRYAGWGECAPPMEAPPKPYDEVPAPAPVPVPVPAPVPAPVPPALPRLDGTLEVPY